MLEYDLRRLSEHPLRFRDLIPAAIVSFGAAPRGEFAIATRWRRSAGEADRHDDLVLRWDVAALGAELPHLEDDIAILRERDEDEARRTELAAVIVAVAMMAHLEPGSSFTRRSRIGTAHDYYLNETRDEMIEIAGRWEGGLPGLFDLKREQSGRNPGLRKRWVSVTVFAGTPRNRTEGLHP